MKNTNNNIGVDFFKRKIQFLIMFFFIAPGLVSTNIIAEDLDEQSQTMETKGCNSCGRDCGCCKDKNCNSCGKCCKNCSCGKNCNSCGKSCGCCKKFQDTVDATESSELDMQQ